MTAKDCRYQLTNVMISHHYNMHINTLFITATQSNTPAVTCSAPLVQTGERKQFSLFDLDL